MSIDTNPGGVYMSSLRPKRKRQRTLLQRLEFTADRHTEITENVDELNRELKEIETELRELNKDITKARSEVINNNLNGLRV